jgi:hypothetical protein
MREEISEGKIAIKVNMNMKEFSKLSIRFAGLGAPPTGKKILIFRRSGTLPDSGNYTLLETPKSINL